MYVIFTFSLYFISSYWLQHSIEMFSFNHSFINSEFTVITGSERRMCSTVHWGDVVVLVVKVPGRSG